MCIRDRCLIGGIPLDLKTSPFMGGQLQRRPHGGCVVLGVHDDLPAPIHEAGRAVGRVHPAIIHPPAVDDRDETTDVGL